MDNPNAANIVSEHYIDIIFVRVQLLEHIPTRDTQDIVVIHVNGITIADNAANFVR